MLKARLPPRLTPLAASLGLRPFYGDLHNHCGLSYGHGRLEDALERARRQLDFVSVTGHAHWPDMPVDDPEAAHIVSFHVEGFARLARLWPGHFETLRRFHQHGSFTVFPGYEIHSGAHGDYTILYKDLTQREMVLQDCPSALRAELERRYPGAAMGFPHHIGYRLGARGVNWASLDPRFAPVLEMLSMHGCSETSLGERPFLHSMGPSDGHGTVRHGLALGHVFGVLGNTDHHSGYPGSYGHGRSCIYAAANTSQEIWDALWQRRSNALTGDCSHLFLRSGDVIQGGILPPGDRKLSIEAVGGSFIDTIDVIRSGRLAARISPELQPSPVAGSDDPFETILVLELGWGARGSAHCWEGSLEVTGGEILAVEPRLRGSEVVSPLEGEEQISEPDRIDASRDRLLFAVTAQANPNNMTPATQAIAVRLRMTPGAVFQASFHDRTIRMEASRLLESALSGNLRGIDSPAFRFHPLPRPDQWQWQGSLTLDDFRDGENVYLRMRQANGQSSWTSPIFCRA
ncbi:hypothetical protein [Geminicoccus roseus]|uniref:hypothetical protein n=1 Tax=Geminicoccus roseus TaxID=404900 RepID=UPI00041C69F0|nr:hypothetical protein [Geminicoccus roseus]